MKLVKLVEDTLQDRGWAAAVRTGGQVFTADCHHDAWCEYYDAATDLTDEQIADRIVSGDHPSDQQEGFLSPEGTFMSRTAAINRWRVEAGFKPKWDGDREWGDSSDLQQ